MKDLQEAISNLSPRKRQLFEQRLKERRGVPSAQTIPPRNLFSPAPLSYIQEGLWFLYELEPESPIYNIPAAVRIQGRLQIAHLEASLNAIVQRHEILRTTFSQHQGEPAQLIAESLTLQLPVADLSSFADAEREARFQKLASEEVLRLFDLNRGPLLRCTLVRLGDEEHILVLVMHHIASDGWSMGVLFKELAAALRGTLGREAIAAPAAALAVCGLRALAASVAAGRGPGGTDRLLEAAACGGAERIGAACGQAAGFRAGFSGSHPDKVVGLRPGGRVEGSEPAGGRDAVHDAAGGL